MTQRFQKILFDIEDESGGWYLEWTVELRTWCIDCRRYEDTVLAKTTMPFIVDTIVNGGKRNNHYVLTVKAI